MSKRSSKVGSLGLVWRLKRNLGCFQLLTLTSLEYGPHFCPKRLLELQCAYPSSGWIEKGKKGTPFQHFFTITQLFHFYVTDTWSHLTAGKGEKGRLIGGFQYAIIKMCVL